MVKDVDITGDEIAIIIVLMADEVPLTIIYNADCFIRVINLYFIINC